MWAASDATARSQIAAFDYEQEHQPSLRYGWQASTIRKDENGSVCLTELTALRFGETRKPRSLQGSNQLIFRCSFDAAQPPFDNSQPDVAFP